MFIVPIQPMKMEGLSDSPARQLAGGGMPFKQVLQQAVQTAQQAGQIAQQDSYNLALGKSDDLSKVMLNSVRQEAAVKMTVELTARAVNAYKEIMQMQV